MAIHRIDLIDGLNDGGINRLLCCAGTGCGTNISTFQNIHGSDLNVTDFIIDTTGSGVTVTIVSINGGPVTFPFLVPDGDTFTMEFEVCWDGVTSPLGTWTGQFDTAEHAPDLEFNFLMGCIDSSSLTWSTTSLDFIDAPAGFPTTQTITMSTIFRFTQLYPLTISGCTGVTVTPNPMVINQGMTSSFDVTWTPTGPGESLSCTIDDDCGGTFTLTGNSIGLTCDNCLCCVDISIKTENGYLPDQNGLCDTENIYNTASFLEKKTIVFSMVYPAGINSTVAFQFSPALFFAECLTPFDDPESGLPVHYYHRYISGLNPDGVAQPMTLVGAGTNAMNQKNWECFFRPVNASTGLFNIELTFFNIQDFQNVLQNLVFDNGLKLKRNVVSATTDYTNTFPSVYNSNRIIGGTFHIIDPTIGDDFTFCQHYVCPNYTARFYNKGLYNGPSEFTNPTWLLQRTIGTVVNFSTLEKTRVRFSVNVPAIYGAGNPVCIFHLFDVTNVDNSVDFLTSTDSSRYRVLNYSGTGVLDNHLVRPGNVSAFGTNFTFDLHVGTTVNPGSRYRMAAIVYGSDGTMVNTFLSPLDWPVVNVPDPDCDCTLDFDSTWLQYWQTTNSEAFQPAPKERIGHDLSIDVGNMGNCLATWGFSGDWRTLVKQVRLNIYKRSSAFPTAVQTTFFQYETHQSIRNTSFPNNYQNVNDLIVEDNGTGGLDTTILNRRVRWENVAFQPGLVQTANTVNYMNRIPAGPNTATYIANTGTIDSWINNEVYFEYVFTLDLFSVIGVPYLWNVVKAFPVRAINFEPLSTYGTYLTDVTIYGRDTLTGPWTELTGAICFKDFLQIRLVYQSDREGNFLFFAEPEPFGLSLLQENDEVPSNNGMTQLMSNLVVSMDTAFDPVLFTAEVILDAQAMTADRYLFCGYISNPEVGQTCEYFIRHQKFGSVGIVVNPPIQWGPDINVQWPGISFGYVTMTVQNPPTDFPVPGEIYVFEWAFLNPTVAAIDVWFGQWGFAGPPNLTLPIGSTSGSFSFTWSGDATGRWCFRQPSGPAMTNGANFRIGNALCP